MQYHELSPVTCVAVTRKNTNWLAETFALPMAWWSLTSTLWNTAISSSPCFQSEKCSCPAYWCCLGGVESKVWPFYKEKPFEILRSLHTWRITLQKHKERCLFFLIKLRDWEQGGWKKKKISIWKKKNLNFDRVQLTCSISRIKANKSDCCYQIFAELNMSFLTPVSDSLRAMISVFSFFCCRYW